MAEPSALTSIPTKKDGCVMSESTDQIRKGLMKMAISEVEKKGPGVLMVETDKPPVYVILDDVTPVPFRQALAHMHETEGSTYCFMGFVDAQQVHLVKVLKRPTAEPV